MSSSNITDYRTYGATVLDRLITISIPAALKSYVTAFNTAHTAYESAATKADAARDARDAALAAVGEVDDLFDDSVGVLANKLIGAGIGSRQNAFRGLSKHAPSKLTSLPYADEPEAIRAIAKALGKEKKLPPEVKTALAACLKNAEALEKGLSKLTAPQAEFDEARGKRDALLPAWVKALNRLKKHANAVWDEEPSKYQAVFSSPSAVQAPKKKRAKKTAKKIAAPAA